MISYLAVNILLLQLPTLTTPFFKEIRHFRSGLSLVWQHDWISLPVLYPQLVFTATHVYFILALFARQFIVSSDERAGDAVCNSYIHL